VKAWRLRPALSPFRRRVSCSPVAPSGAAANLLSLARVHAGTSRVSTIARRRQGRRATGESSSEPATPPALQAVARLRERGAALTGGALAPGSR
jgi:hypothetical protein